MKPSSRSNRRARFARRDPDDRQGVDEPEAGDEEGPLAALKPVLGAIAVDEIALPQLALNAFHGLIEKPAWDRKPEQRDLQQGRIDLLKPERLGEIRRIARDTLIQDTPSRIASRSRRQTGLSPNKFQTRDRGATQAMTLPWV